MILFDGCSYTFGGELENPEKDAFPHLISRMGLMNGAKSRNYRSIAKCGKSNDGILRTTLDFCEKNPVSLAVIQFTVYSRREIFDNKKNGYFFISAQNNDEGSVEYYKNLQNLKFCKFTILPPIPIAKFILIGDETPSNVVDVGIWNGCCCILCSRKSSLGKRRCAF